MIKNKRCLLAALLGAAQLFASAAQAFDGGQANPIDTQSNPNALQFSDVRMGVGDFKAPFVRDGVVAEPQRFRAIVAGLPQAQLQSQLGAPLREQQGPRGLEWDYNFSLRMAPSKNLLVCQYKVVFDAQQLVRETSWRRRQCQQLAEGSAAR